jgi:hypothetical protein
LSQALSFAVKVNQFELFWPLQQEIVGENLTNRLVS